MILKYLLPLSLLLLSNLGGASPHVTTTPVVAVDLAQVSDLPGILPRLKSARVVFVGEIHDRNDHHRNQLSIIHHLHRVHGKIAVGLEQFQQPAQATLDRYISGEIDESTMLSESGYFERWRFDYRLYAPILRYAQAHQLPLIALNLPSELTGAVSRTGIAGLSPEQRGQLPEIDRSDIAYRQRLEQIFSHHPQTPNRDPNRFLEVQLLWDEGMAERAARFLREHPEHVLVVLAGNGHVAYRGGIPDRLRRRLALPYAVVINGELGQAQDYAGNFLLESQPEPLPKPGRLGLLLRADERPGMVVAELMEGSAAAEVGIDVGDRIIELNGRPIRSMSDVSVVLWDKSPGASVNLLFETKQGLFRRLQRRELTVRLR